MFEKEFLQKCQEYLNLDQREIKLLMCATSSFVQVIHPFFLRESKITKCLFLKRRGKNGERESVCCESKRVEDNDTYIIAMRNVRINFVAFKSKGEKKRL